MKYPPGRKTRLVSLSAWSRLSLPGIHMTPCAVNKAPLKLSSPYRSLIASPTSNGIQASSLLGEGSGSLDHTV